MIKMVSCKCPECKAELEISGDREYAYCQYCGTKILLHNDNVKVFRKIDEAEIKKTESNERMYNRMLDREDRKLSLKTKGIIAYVIICLVMCLASYLSYKFKAGFTSVVLVMATIVLITMPFLIGISRSIFKYDETTVTTDTSSALFGLFKKSTQETDSPAKKVLGMWGTYLAVLALIFMLLHLGTYSDKKEKPTGASYTTEAYQENDTVIVPVFYKSIEKRADIKAEDIGSTFSWMHDAWDCYTATILSETTIQVTNWHRDSSDEKEKFKQGYDLNALKIADDKFDFTWVDESHTAFLVTLMDEKNSRWDDYYRVAFSKIDTSSNAWKKRYSSEGKQYVYQNDKWNQYRAIALSDTTIKIENWYRSSADEKQDYYHHYDMCIVKTDNENSDFEWVNEEHSSFTITMFDEENHHWEDVATVCFQLQDEEGRKSWFPFG